MIGSILIYGAAYLLSIGLLWIYCKYVHVEEIQNKWRRNLIRILWLILIISPLVIVAALRYYTGTDYYIYQKYYYLNEQHGLQYFLKGSGNLSELLFWGSLELGRLLFGNVQGFLLIASFVTLLMVILALDKYRGKINIVWAYFIFLMILFPTTLNIVRQMIAVAIVMFGLHYIEDNRRLRFVICVIVATLFHTSAIICLAFLLLFESKNKSVERYRNRALWVGLVVLPVLVPVLLWVAGSLPIFNKYFSNYAIEFAPRWGLVLKRLPIIVLAVMYYKKLKLADKKNVAYIQMLLMQLSLFIVTFYTKWGFRLAYYLDFATMIIIPKIIAVEKDKKRKMLLAVSITVYLIAYYVYSFVVLNQDGVYPYKSILGGA